MVEYEGMDTKPQMVVTSFYDKYDEEGERLYKEFQKDDTKIEYLAQAASNYERSKNPDGRKMALLARGLFYRQRGIKEKADEKALRDLLKAQTMLIKAVGKEDIIYKRIRLEYLKRKITPSEDFHAKPSLSILLERANLFNDLGDLPNYNIEMTLYHMFAMTNGDIDNREETLKNADLMFKHAKETSKDELFYKAKGLYHQVRAALSNNAKEALPELVKELDAIALTSDKYGKDNAETQLLFAKAMLTTNKSQREKMLSAVSKTFEEKGDRKRAEFAKKLLSPLPIRVGHALRLAKEAIEKQQELSKKIHEVMPLIKPGPYPLFHHHSYLLGRIKDVSRLIRRLGETRKIINDLNIKEDVLRPKKIRPGKPYSKKLNSLLNLSNNYTEQMRQDMESLYIYGNLALDQLAQTIAYLVGIENPESFNFLSLVLLLQKKDYQGPLLPFWTRHQRDIIWLYYQLRFVRNIFIEHIDKPWQRGTTMSRFGDDFNLFIPTPPGWLDAEAMTKQMEGIKHLAPQWLQDAPDDYWEKKNLKRVLEITFYNIEQIPAQVDRDKVWKVWSDVGGSTPSYEIIAVRLTNFLKESTDTLTTITVSNKSLINLGSNKTP